MPPKNFHDRQQVITEELILDLRIVKAVTNFLVLSAGKTKHIVVPLRSSRCAGAVEADRRFCLHPRPWSRRALQRALSEQNPGALGAAHQHVGKAGTHVYVYFDNDQKSAAPADALKLKRLVAPTGRRR